MEYFFLNALKECNNFSLQFLLFYKSCCIALLGRTIICTIHQPSSSIFDKFSKVLLLSQGRVVFFGDRLATLLYFSHLGRPCPPFTSVPEFLLELLVKEQITGRNQSGDTAELTSERCAGRTPQEKYTCFKLHLYSNQINPDIHYCILNCNV